MVASARRIVRCTLIATLIGAVAAVPLFGWGQRGHYLTGQAAAARLPDAMPAFFRAAAAQLAYLNPDPDRWKSREESALDPAMDQASSADHFIDMEMLPPDRLAAALAAPNRYAYADTLRAAGVEPEKMGFLPFRILELSQRVREEFRLYRAAPNDQVRQWIEARIINDAGLLGHYVADGSNPAHTTVNYNGWTGPNPNGYATDKRFHSRFESAYVETHIKIDDVLPEVNPEAKSVGDFRSAIIAYLHQTNSQVERLYQLDKAAPFNTTTTAPANKEFTDTRLAAGAEMLRNLWWTAWITSAPADSAARSTPR
jgi:hypothetical protein